MQSICKDREAGIDNLRILKHLKFKFNEIINDTRGECNIDFTKNFTPEQSAAFEGFIDFLACMVGKYSSTIDEIITDKKTA